MADNPSRFVPEMIRGNTEWLLLSLISALNGAYGYQLIREIESRSRGVLQFKEGTVYPALRKLESEGLIKGEWETLAAGHKRRVYNMTAKGQQVLDKKTSEWHEFARTMNLILNPNRT